MFYDTVTATAKTLSDPATAIHLTLDVLGMIPVIGEPADGLNALIYLAEGDEVNAAISAAGMLPIGGMAATGARAVKTAVKTGLEAAAQISATSVTMIKVTPPAPTAVLKVDTSAATMPTAPVGAATPPAPKQIEAAPVRLQIEAATPAKLDELAAGKEVIVHPFAGGASAVAPASVLEDFASSPFAGNPAGMFVAPTSAIDDLIATSKSPRQVESSLGLLPDSLGEGGIAVIRISDALDPDLALRMPDPSLGNVLHVPNSGLTIGGFPEAVIVTPLKTDPRVTIDVVRFS